MNTNIKIKYILNKFICVFMLRVWMHQCWLKRYKTDNLEMSWRLVRARKRPKVQVGKQQSNPIVKHSFVHHVHLTSILFYSHKSNNNKSKWKSAQTLSNVTFICTIVSECAHSISNICNTLNVFRSLIALCVFVCNIS